MKGVSETAWLNARMPQWNALSSQAQILQHRPASSVAQALDLVDGYRSVARDLSVAQSLNPASRAAAGLKALQYRLHGLIHVIPRPDGGASGTSSGMECPGRRARSRARSSGPAC